MLMIFFLTPVCEKLVIGTEPQGQFQLSTDVKLLSPYNFSLIIITVFLRVCCSFLGALLVIIMKLCFIKKVLSS